MDMPNPDLGVRAGSLAAMLRVDGAVGISQEKWRRKGTEGRGNSMVRTSKYVQPWQ